MRVLLTGSNGFLGQKFCEKLSEYSEIKAILGVSKSLNRNSYLDENTFKQIDLLDYESFLEIINAFEPTHILHTAALTAVETCEEKPKLAQQINVDLSAQLAQIAKQKNIHYTFISTDFVFDGLNGPYKETDAVKATNNYGQTKIDAEQQITAVNTDAAILRTILVYGAIPDKNRSNLILWAKKQLENGSPIKVVSDQWRMPTWVDDLADASYSAMQKRTSGIFHISGNEMMTVLEAVATLADTWNFDKSLISPITAAEIGQATNRPRKTGFILDKAEQILNYKPTSFVVSLQKINEQLKKYNS
ncbi:MULTISPECIES: SDR family oxidoreductase [Sphingobacterium]|jgi:dTDP-4-dehydrorhamnose reductase|uniref:dTDP-4-dehydrorhamnose reductase n=1 Tax=Sphingobacterium litopenaei TaxID=2763500 RepID=A0ABR7YIC8_9SPHI|nr:MULTISPECIES: SDR family oxidoreductase [Sphingobacterium]MBD1431078.1 SDR family oxidoreductase [Sphingobacterium litopenaei]NGM74725.1 SDR family oxidoreductase [Sphingobacterium sp. SGL-16]